MRRIRRTSRSPTARRVIYQMRSDAPQRSSRLRLTASILAITAALVGVVVMVGGWMMDISLLRTIIAGAASMKFNTAMCLVLIACALLSDLSNLSSLRSAGLVAAWLPILISLATLFEDLTGRDLGIDQLFIVDRTSPVLVTAPGRMAVTTALSFLLLGLALLIQRNPRGLIRGQAAVCAVAAICVSNLVGYFFGIDNFTGIAFYTAMAVHTSGCLLILSFSVFLSRPESGFVRLAAADTLGGVMIRRLLPAAAVIPILLGWLRWQGELRGYYGSAFGVALYATANVAVFVAITLASAPRYKRMTQRNQSQDAAVLVVDDEPMLVDIFSEWLSLEGYRVYTAGNGIQALRVLSENRVDAIVTDVRMPVMDGPALLRKLRTSGLRVPKIIFISAFTDLSTREVFDLGVEAILEKPVKMDRFIAAVVKVLRPRLEAWGDPPVSGGAMLFASLPPVQAAIARGYVAFGQGGFCLRHDPVREEPIRFHLDFQPEPVPLIGYGIVRWTDFRERLIGVEISNLDDSCREWAADLIATRASTSYIPGSCREFLADPATGNR
jgi:CheY-like chemotaxis protein